MSLVIHLDDYTDRGHEWRFWETATILDNSDFNNDNFDELYPELHLRHFQGKFGNQERLVIFLQSILKRYWATNPYFI